MGKIKELWNHSSQEVRSTLLQYPCTVTVVVLATILEIVVMDVESEMLTELVRPFLYLFGIGLFLAESSIFRGKRWRIGISVLTAVVSAILTYSMFANTALGEDSLTARGTMAYVIVLLICGVYFCFRRSGQPLHQYVLKVFSNVMKTHIIYVILMIGMFIISAILYALLIDDYNFDIISRFMILLSGFFYVPSWLCALSRVQGEVDGFTKTVVKYVLLPLNLVIFCIIYIYVLKILILRDVPSNEIFGILTGVFLLAAPTWTMMETYDRQSMWCRIAEKLPLIFAPLLLLQIYSVVVRILEFGVTPSRYLGILWIVFEMIYLFIHWKQRKNIGTIFLIGAFAAFLALLMPFLNMYSISRVSQESILAQYRKGKALSNEEKEKIYGAYRYLCELGDSEKYIEDKYTAEEIEKIKEFDQFYGGSGYDSEITKLYISTDERINKVNVSDYASMQVVQYGMNYNDPAPNLSELQLVEYGTDRVVLVADVESLMKEYVAYALQDLPEDSYRVEIDSYYLEHSQIDIDDKTVLIIRNFDITYDHESQEIEQLELLGYLFQKDEGIAGDTENGEDLL